MASVHIPAPLRTLTDGRADLEVEGATLGELIDRLEEKHPGLRARLLEEGRLRPGIAAFIDGVQSAGLQTKLNPDSEVYFSPAISRSTRIFTASHGSPSQSSFGVSKYMGIAARERSVKTW